MESAPEQRPTTSSRSRLTARVEGRVQGVGFRYFVRKTARELDLHGFVRNERDGSVHLEAEGPRERLEEFLAAIHQGPAGARVNHVETRWADARGEFQGFSVRS